MSFSFLAVVFLALLLSGTFFPASNPQGPKLVVHATMSRTRLTCAAAPSSSKSSVGLHGARITVEYNQTGVPRNRGVILKPTNNYRRLNKIYLPLAKERRASVLPRRPHLLTAGPLSAQFKNSQNYSILFFFRQNRHKNLKRINIFLITEIPLRISLLFPFEPN